MPTTASINAQAAKIPISHIVKRDCAVCCPTSSAIGVTSKTVIVESTPRTAVRTDGASDTGGTDVRTTSDTCCARSMNGKYRSGSGVGLSGSPRYFMSPTTPTIDSHGDLFVNEPCLIRLPIGSWPGQNRVTTRSLTTTAVESGALSLSIKLRPAFSGTRIVAKKSGVTRCTYARGEFFAFTGGCRL